MDVRQEIEERKEVDERNVKKKEIEGQRGIE